MQSAPSKPRAKSAPEPEIIDVLPTLADEPIEESPDVALDAAFARLRADLGDDGDLRLSVWRIAPGARDQFVTAVTLSEVESGASMLDDLQRQFGGGTYRVRGHDARGFVLNRKVEVAEPPKRKDAGALDAVAALFDRQQAQFAAMLDRLAPRADSEESVLARLKTMREILAPAGGSGGGSVRELMGMFQQGLQLGQSLQPKEGAEVSDVLVETLRAFAPVVKAATAKQTASPRAPVAAGTVQPAAAIPAPVAGAAAAPTVDPAALRPLLSMMLRAAAADGDPSLYAELLFDQAGAEAVAQVFEAGDPVDLLAAFEPRVSAHRAWFEQVRDALAELLSDEAAEAASGGADGAAGRAGGRADDAAGHAGADPRPAG